MSQIDIIVDQNDFLEKTNNTVGLLLETPFDGSIKNTTNTIVQKCELIGDHEENKRLAAEFVTTVLCHEPRIRDIPQLSVYEEELILEFTRFFQVAHLHNFLVRNQFHVCKFFSYIWCARVLQDFSRIENSNLQVVFPKKNKKKHTLYKKIFSSLFFYDEFRQNLGQVLSRIDPFHRRKHVLSYFIYKKRPHVDKKKLWFLSYAANYTNIGLAYEKLFPENFNFLVEDPNTGGKPLKKNNRSFINLYDYGDNTCIPKKNEIVNSAKAILEYLNTHQFYGTHNKIFKLFLGSELLKNFLHKQLPYGLYVSAVLKKWLIITKPLAVIVGNNASERSALFLLQKKNIPTILLQHGSYGDFYQYIDSPVNHYLARGEFWSNFLFDSARKRTFIINPPGTTKDFFVPADKKPSKPFIIYFSTLYPEKSSYFYEDLDARLLAIGESVSQGNAKLIIRLHPLDSISLQIKYIKNLYKKNSIDVDLQFSYQESIAEILIGASSAIMHYSTVFLDCVCFNIPIISFDWLHFSLKKYIQQYDIFYFSKDLTHLKCLVKKSLLNELRPSKINIEFFLAKDKPNEQKIILENMCRSSGDQK